MYKQTHIYTHARTHTHTRTHTHRKEEIRGHDEHRPAVSRIVVDVLPIHVSLGDDVGAPWQIVVSSQHTPPHVHDSVSAHASTHLKRTQENQNESACASTTVKRVIID